MAGSAASAGRPEEVWGVGAQQAGGVGGGAVRGVQQAEEGGQQVGLVSVAMVFTIFLLQNATCLGGVIWVVAGLVQCLVQQGEGAYHGILLKGGQCGKGARDAVGHVAGDPFHQFVPRSSERESADPAVGGRSLAGQESLCFKVFDLAAEGGDVHAELLGHLVHGGGGLALNLEENLSLEWGYLFAAAGGAPCSGEHGDPSAEEAHLVDKRLSRVWCAVSIHGK